MTHVSMAALALLWVNGAREGLGSLCSNASNACGIEGVDWVGSIHIERLPTVDCPECRRLVWLATGERDLGDGL